MARIVKCICDRCKKEIPEAETVAVQGDITVFKRYALKPGHPEQGVGAKSDVLFGRCNSEGIQSQTFDFCHSCWEKTESHFNAIFKEKQ